MELSPSNFGDCRCIFFSLTRPFLTFIMRQENRFDESSVFKLDNSTKSRAYLIEFSANSLVSYQSLPTKNKRKGFEIDAPRKRRKLSADVPKSSLEASSGVPLLPGVNPSPRRETSETAKLDRVNGESRAALRTMVAGHDVYSEAHRRYANCTSSNS